MHKMTHTDNSRILHGDAMNVGSTRGRQSMEATRTTATTTGIVVDGREWDLSNLSVYAHGDNESDTDLGGPVEECEEEEEEWRPPVYPSVSEIPTCLDVDDIFEKLKSENLLSRGRLANPRLGSTSPSGRKKPSPSGKMSPSRRGSSKEKVVGYKGTTRTKQPRPNPFSVTMDDMVRQDDFKSESELRREEEEEQERRIQREQERRREESRRRAEEEYRARMRYEEEERHLSRMRYAEEEEYRRSRSYEDPRLDDPRYSRSSGDDDYYDNDNDDRSCDFDRYDRNYPHEDHPSRDYNTDEYYDRRRDSHDYDDSGYDDEGPDCDQYSDNYDRRHNDNVSSGSDSDDRLLVEVTPGEFVPLRGSAETWDAVVCGRVAGVTCFGCSIALVCIDDADMVMCPACRVISPVEGEYNGGGLGLGMREEDATYELRRLRESRMDGHCR